MKLYPYPAHSDEQRIVLYGAWCPACDLEHGFRVDTEYWAREGLDVWGFDGDLDDPTFTGSMLSNRDEHPGYPRCHSYLEAGVWRFLDDCTHELAGQNVPMVEYPAEVVVKNARRQRPD